MESEYIMLYVVAIVLLPGIFWALIDLKLYPIPRPRFSLFIAKAFLFGIVAYILTILILLAAALHSVMFAPVTENNLLKAQLDSIQNLDSTENSLFIFIAIVLTFALTPGFALIWSLFKGAKPDERRTMSKQNKIPVWGERPGGTFPDPPVNRDGTTQRPPPLPPDKPIRASDFYDRHGNLKKNWEKLLE